MDAAAGSEQFDAVVDGATTIMIRATKSNAVSSPPNKLKAKSDVVGQFHSDPIAREKSSESFCSFVVPRENQKVGVSIAAAQPRRLVAGVTEVVSLAANQIVDGRHCKIRILWEARGTWLRFVDAAQFVVNPIDLRLHRVPTEDP
jgi:hypothetical protein